MQSKFQKVFLVIICFSLVLSCKKKSSTNNSNNSSTSTTTGNTPAISSSFTANKNGVAWSGTQNSATYIIDDDNQISAIAINGVTSSDLISMGIDFPNANENPSVGNPDLGLTNDDAVFVYSTKTSGGGTLTQHFPDEATINITAVDLANKRVSGNFTCKMHKVGSTAAADSIKFTNGVFTNIPYTVAHQ